MQVGLREAVLALACSASDESGHGVGAAFRAACVLAATAAELAPATIVTAQSARAGRVEPLKTIESPLDVLCQQLIGMACEGEWATDDAFALVLQSCARWPVSPGPISTIVLAFLAGDLAAPAGAYEPEPGSALPKVDVSEGLWRAGAGFSGCGACGSCGSSGPTSGRSFRRNRSA